mgnify:CR=1 FL=1
MLVDRVICTRGYQNPVQIVQRRDRQWQLVVSSSCLNVNGSGGSSGVKPCKNTFQHMAEFGPPRFLIQDVLAPPDHQRLQIGHHLVRPWPKVLCIPSWQEDRCHELIRRTLSSEHCSD